MKFKLIASVLVLAVALTGVIGATAAWFSDVGTSDGNTFTAGSLDLRVNGTDANVTLFNLSNEYPEKYVVPGNQPKNEYEITNTGSIDGYLNIKNIEIINLDNGTNGPELAAGDTADNDVGELGNFLNIRLFIDTNNDGWISTGENVFFDGRINAMPDKFLLNEKIPAGGVIKVVAVIFDWWSSSNDNLAQTDKVTINLDFTLDQKAQ